MGLSIAAGAEEFRLQSLSAAILNGGIRRPPPLTLFDIALATQTFERERRRRGEDH